MVKLDDVAKLAGVSKGTASRVLNNRGYISQQTRERIEAAVKELNYYPNENARNLLKRRSGMIGVVVPTITYPYYSEMISFLEKFLKASGYKILLCNIVQFRCIAGLYQAPQQQSCRRSHYFQL